MDEMMQISGWKRIAMWLLCWLCVGVWLSGQGCLQQDLAALDLPVAVVRSLTRRDKNISSSRGHAVVVIDIGKGWSEAYRWPETTRVQRCMEVWQGLQKALDLGAAVVGVDLLLGRDRTGQPHTCSPRTPQEKAWWRGIIQRAPEQIVLPLAMEIPRYVDLRGRQLHTSLPEGAFDPPSIRLSEPVMVPGYKRLAHGHVALFAQGGLLRRAWPSLSLSLSSSVHTSTRRELPSMAAELERLAQQRAALRNARVQTQPARLSPLVIHWDPSRVQHFQLRHLEAPAASLRRHLRDAVVLVGAVTAPMQEDIFDSPLGLLSGVQIHAHTVATMLDGPRPMPMHWMVLWLVLLVCWALGAWVGWSMWPWFVRLVLGGLLLTGLWIIAGYGLYLYGWVSPVVGGLAGFLMGSFVGLHERLRGQREQLHELQDRIYLAIRPSIGSDSPASRTEGAASIRQDTSLVTSLLQRYPRPIAALLGRTLDSTDIQSRSQGTVALYRCTMAYSCTILHQLNDPTQELALQWSDAMGNYQRWVALATTTWKGHSKTAPVEALSQALFPSAAWEVRAISQLQHTCELLLDTVHSGDATTHLSFFEREGLQRECWDMLLWFLGERLSCLAELPLIWVQSVPFPDAHLALCQDPWKQLWREPVICPMMGRVEAKPRQDQGLPGAYGLGYEQLYVAAAGRWSALAPYWVMTPHRETGGQAFFCLEQPIKQGQVHTSAEGSLTHYQPLWSGG